MTNQPTAATRPTRPGRRCIRWRSHRPAPRSESLNDADAARSAALTLEAAGVHFDATRQRMTPETLTALQLADERGVLAWRDAMLAGVHINVTEDRAVLHTALRRSADSPITSTATTWPERSTTFSTGWVSLLSRYARASGLERRARGSRPSSTSASVDRTSDRRWPTSRCGTTARATSRFASSPTSTRRT